MTKLDRACREVRLSTTPEVPTTQAESKSEVLTMERSSAERSSRRQRPSSPDLPDGPSSSYDATAPTWPGCCFLKARSRWAVAGRGMECTAAATRPQRMSLRSPILLLASRASFAAASLAALHALHPQNALLVAGPLIPRFFPPSRIRLWWPRVAPRPAVSPWLPRSFWSSHCDPRRRQMSPACPSPRSRPVISS